jgi:putative flavoprotein involved in K+ transport
MILEADVSTVIWGHWLRPRLAWIDAPILDELRYPRQVRGVAAVPGLFFLGLLWQHSQASAFLVGPALDGPYLLESSLTTEDR